MSYLLSQNIPFNLNCFTDADDLLLQMTMANLDNQNHETSETHVSSSPPISTSPSLINTTDHEKSGSPNLIESQNQPSSSSSPQPVDQSEDEEKKEIKEEASKESNSESNEDVSAKVGQTEEVVDDQKPSTSPKLKNDPNRPMNANAVPPQKPTNNRSTEERTSDLIKKQMNEIEKEISRRMQNQNIRKVCLFHIENFCNSLIK